MENEFDVEVETEETEESQETEVMEETESSEDSEENETTETPESGDDLTLDYERLESAIMSDEFTLDSDLNDLFLTDVLLLLIVFVLAAVFASKEV